MQERVKGPAIALIVVGILGGVLGIINLLGSALMSSLAKRIGTFSEEQLAEMERMGQGQTLMSVVLSLLVLGGSAFIIFGALQMMKLRGWTIALVASILAMIPFFTCCACFLGVPVGVWSIIVLSNADVKRAFQQGVTPS
jgi:hypothetical protein